MVDGHKGLSLFGLRGKMGSFGVFRFWGLLGVADRACRSCIYGGTRVGRTGRIGRMSIESKGDGDVEFGKWVRGGIGKSLRRSYFPRRVWGEFWQGARPALQIVGLTGDRIVAGHAPIFCDNH